MAINFDNLPVEPTITIIDPNGKELITTNNITTFTWIRLEIKKNKLKGYKVKTANCDIFDIKSNGKIYDEDYHWPDGITGNVYDKLLVELI